MWQSASRRTSVERSVVASAPTQAPSRNFGFFPSLWMCRSIAQGKSFRALGCRLHVPVFRFCRMLSSTPQRFSHSLTLLFGFVHKRNNNRYASRCTTYILMPLSVLVCREWVWGAMEDFNSYENFYVFQNVLRLCFLCWKATYVWTAKWRVKWRWQGDFFSLFKIIRLLLIVHRFKMIKLMIYC